MKYQLSIPVIGSFPTIWVGDANSTCDEYLGLGTGCIPNLYWPWKNALEILGAAEGVPSGVIPKIVWNRDFINLTASGQAAVTSPEDRQIQLGCDTDPEKSRQSQFEGMISSGDLVIENATALPQIASIWTHEVVQNGPSSPAVNTKSEPSIADRIDQSDAQLRTERSFEISSIKVQTLNFGVLGHLDTMAPESVWRSDVLNLLASGRGLSPAPHDQQCPPQDGAESKKSAKAQPEEINLDEVLFIQSATEKFKRACLSTKKSPDLPTENPRLAKNYSSNRIPRASDSTPKVVRSRASFPPKNSKLEPGIGSWVDQSDARLRAEQSFDFTLIESLPAQCRVIDGLHAMAYETNSRRHFSYCRADFETTTPLLSRLTRSDLYSISPAMCQSRDPGSAKSATQNADEAPPSPPHGWSDSQTSHMPLGHPAEVHAQIFWRMPQQFPRSRARKPGARSTFNEHKAQPKHHHE